MNHLNDMIFVLDNILTVGQCRTAIERYYQLGPVEKYCDFYPMQGAEKDAVLSPLIDLIRSKVALVTPGAVKVDWAQVVRWPVGSFMEPHLDIAQQDTIWTSITYLNDDYTGGQTYIVDDIMFVPRVGRTICFNGQHYFHGVTPVSSGQRWTIPIWYNSADYKTISSQCDLRYD